MTDGIALADYRYGEIDVTDEELLERVAAVEGRKRFTPWKDVDVDSRTIYEGVLEWNPLTHDAQAFEMLVKHELSLSRVFNGEEVGVGWLVWSRDGCDEFEDHNLNRAILLAIAAKGE